jgi:hypothetical protein
MVENFIGVKAKIPGEKKGKNLRKYSVSNSEGVRS